jgi:hypothetical protein
MWDPAYDQIIMWVGLAVLVMFCLPLAGPQKLVLTVYAWALRLALIGLLAAGGYLWFHPTEMPSEVSGLTGRYPLLARLLPDPSARHFGVCAASLLVAALLPVLALLDVGRKLGGWRLHRLRTLAALDLTHLTASAPAAALPGAELAPAAPPRRVDRATAAATLAGAVRRHG